MKTSILKLLLLISLQTPEADGYTKDLLMTYPKFIREPHLNWIAVNIKKYFKDVEYGYQLVSQHITKLEDAAFTYWWREREKIKDKAELWAWKEEMKENPRVLLEDRYYEQVLPTRIPNIKGSVISI